MTTSRRALPITPREHAIADADAGVRGKKSVAAVEDWGARTWEEADTRFVRVLTWMRERLARPRAHAWILALSLVTALPSLWVSYDSDDRFQLAALEAHPRIAGIARAPWDLYSFAKDRASNIALREEGVFPWWADVDAVIAFFRPLSSLSRWVDQTLWPDHVPLMQLHSLLWFAFLAWTASRLYRRFSPSPWVASLALILFTFDEARAATISWLCDRNALIALAFGFSTVIAHDRWRARGDRAAAWWGPGAFALALLGAETALQVCAYLFAYALFLDRGSWRARFGALLPYAGVVVAWAIAYRSLGYGADGSAFYTDPLRHPLLFASQLPGRIGIYALTQFEGVSAEWFNLLPVFGVNPHYVIWPLVFACGLALVAALAPLYRRDPLVRFWAVGALLAAVPACGVEPTDRALTGVGLGGMALLAILLSSLAEKTYPALLVAPTGGSHGDARASSFASRAEPRVATRRWVIAFGIMLAIANLAVAPMLRPFLIAVMDGFDAKVARADANIPRNPEVEQETFVLLNPPFDTFAIFYALYRETEGIPRPERVRWLATGVSDLRVERVDARTLKLTPSTGYLSTLSQQVLRSLDRPLRVGEQVALSDVTFEVLSLTEDGRPKDVLARFTRPLEATKYRWLQWGKHEYVPFQPPAIGQTVTIPAVDLRQLVN